LHIYKIIIAFVFFFIIALLPFVILRRLKTDRDKEKELEKMHKKTDKWESDAEMTNDSDIMGQIDDMTYAMKNALFKKKKRSEFLLQLIAWKRFFKFLIEEWKGSLIKES
jgi:hypothetical protein